LLIDSWSGHNTQLAEEIAPDGKEVIAKTIPPGTTGKIQPLDVFGFRIWKIFLKQFTDRAMLLDINIAFHQRNNIIKMQSLLHNQLQSPRYVNLLKYSFYNVGTLRKGQMNLSIQ